MKHFLLLAAVAVLANPAFASKARMTALGNADHLVDAQTAFDNPAHLTQMGDYVTFEGGATTPAAPTATSWTDIENGLVENPSAEGGFVRSTGDTKYGLYFGRTSAFTNGARRSFGFLRQENPLELQYAQKGAMNWGAAFNYSSSDLKAATNTKKQSAMGARFGASADNWEAFAVVGLGSSADGNDAKNIPSRDIDGDGAFDANELIVLSADPNSKYKGTIGFKLGGAYKVDTTRMYAKYYMDGFQYESTVNTTYNDLKMTQSQLDLGAIETMKFDAGHWFYGAAIQMFEAKTSITAGDIKTTATYLPFLVGVEHDATSWMVLRAAVTQNVLLGSKKIDDGSLSVMPDDANTPRNNTKLAAGLGLKFGKWAVDGSWAASSTGNINTASLMTNLGMTYNF